MKAANLTLKFLLELAALATRIPFELSVFALALAALAFSGHGAWAIALDLVMAINAAAMTVLDRGTVEIQSRNHRLHIVLTSNATIGCTYDSGR